MLTSNNPRGGRRLPPLNALRVFETAARRGSFTLAAQDLGVSQGAVSRQIAHLEDYLSIKLFARNHREVKLTREGAEYAATLGTAFGHIERGTQQLWRTQRQDSLRLKLYPTFAVRWLVPRLGVFNALHPNIDVQITTALESAELARDDVDVTVEFMQRQIGARYDPLFEIELIPVCSPALLRGMPIRNPEDLLQYVLLHALNRPDDWKLWFGSLGIDIPPETGGLQFGTSALVYQAAVDGVGIAIGQARFVEDDLAAGRLVTPFPQSFATGEIYHLVSLQESGNETVVSSFRDCVLSEARERRSRVGSFPHPIAAALEGYPGR